MRCFRRKLLILFAVLLSFSAFLHAEQVKALEPSGVFQLESGQRVALAGLSVPPESMMLLSVIVSGKDLEVDHESSKDYPAEADVKAAYFYVKTFEMDFPFTPGAQPRETRVMVNELLLSLGLAKVDGSKEFKYREKFMKIEAEARLAGQGVWSYELITKKKKS